MSDPRCRSTWPAACRAGSQPKYDPPVLIIDPEDPYRYVEVRGVVDRTDPDPKGAFYVELAQRSDAPFGTAAPKDAADRVVLVVRPTAVGRR